MKSRYLIFTWAALALGTIALSSCSVLAKNKPTKISQSTKQSIIQPKPIEPPKIQLAILLDTSNSMDGLIDQTRNQIWQVVNEFSKAKKNGLTPRLEVALFEYGNDSNSADSGYVRMLNNFTTELDEVSQGLFSLTTNGGSEYCGFAIQTAVNNLNWSQSKDDIRSIFIAGNEAFTQGPVFYQEAVALAKQHRIIVNSIHAGDHLVGIQTGWQQAALATGGDYMSINADRKIHHINAPQDPIIAQLNLQLNLTYLPYGSQGHKKALRQQQQDQETKRLSPALLSKRARSKASSMYRNNSWDLVDAVTDGSITQDTLLQMPNQALPTPMQQLPAEKRMAYVQQQAQSRAQIKQEIEQLSQQRDHYIAQQKKNSQLKQKNMQQKPDMAEALVNAIKKQAQKKNYQFKKSSN